MAAMCPKLVRARLLGSNVTYVSLLDLSSKLNEKKMYTLKANFFIFVSLSKVNIFQQIN